MLSRLYSNWWLFLVVDPYPPLKVPIDLCELYPIERRDYYCFIWTLLWYDLSQWYFSSRSRSFCRLLSLSLEPDIVLCIMAF